ncbi:hypothetical protein ECG_05450 [Echinococcus granulosus]|nr:hypothetical protein ECG_05450 [Echinococcus granulosus]
MCGMFPCAMETFIPFTSGMPPHVHQTDEEKPHAIIGQPQHNQLANQIRGTRQDAYEDGYCFTAEHDFLPFHSGDINLAFQKKMQSQLGWRRLFYWEVDVGGIHSEEEMHIPSF